MSNNKFLHVKNVSKIQVVKKVFTFYFSVLLEIFTQPKKYEILDENEEKIYSMTEESFWLSAMCLKNERPLKVFMYNSEGVEILRFFRPFYYWACCPSQILLVSQNGKIIGYIKQIFSFCEDEYLRVIDKSDEELYRIYKPGFKFQCKLDCYRAYYAVKSSKERKIDFLQK